MSIAEKLTVIAENMPQVYDAGKEAGYDEWWDKFQMNGDRTSYIGAFEKQSESFFRPKYDMHVENAYYMFRDFASRTDMVEYLSELGVVLDFGNCTNFSNFLLWAQIIRLGVLDTHSASDVRMYYAYQLQTIDKLILKEDGTQASNWEGCGNLVNIKSIEGKIGRSWSFSACKKLTIESLKNIISALTDYSGTDNEYKYKLTLHADSLALLENEGAASPNGNTWLEYMTDKRWSY